MTAVNSLSTKNRTDVCQENKFTVAYVAHGFYGLTPQPYHPWKAE